MLDKLYSLICGREIMTLSKKTIILLNKTEIRLTSCTKKILCILWKVYNGFNGYECEEIHGAECL